MKNKKLLIGIGLAILALVIFFIVKGKKPIDMKFFTQVQKGPFEILVSVTGELEAMNKEDIMAPSDLRSEFVRIYQVKIQDLVPEGSLVDSGEFVASLDKTEITTRLREAQDDLEQQRISYERQKLDTSMSLRNERESILNLQYELEERKIALDQSRFEPPATIRQAEINLDKSKRSLENVKKNYNIKVTQAQSSMIEADMRLQRPVRRIEAIQNVMDKFTILAPKKGMVIYAKEWRGEKRKVGSSVSSWDPTVATLPDLSVMISRTYVSEVDINRMRVGQKVRLGVDAFSDRKYSGEVIKVSNVGEQLPNSDTKVFEVIVKIFGSDPVLRPYMTTSNNIIINQFKDTTFIPLETVHSEDSIPFVYTRSGKKQIVILGEMNDNQIIVEKGLKKGDDIYLSVPEKPEGFEMVGKELIPDIKARAQKKKKDKEELERQIRLENEKLKMGRPTVNLTGVLPNGGARKEIRQVSGGKSNR
jgi:HlyD family secretion protein